MFSKISSTVYRPEKPLLIWDGACPFCWFWTIQWKKITKDRVKYIPYQEIYHDIPDIPKSDFQEAARLIDPGGNVCNGPEAAYWCLRSGRVWKGLYFRYKNSPIFRYLSDKAYVYIAGHRSFLLKVTYLFWGKDPEHTRPYWILYLAGFLAILPALLLAL